MLINNRTPETFYTCIKIMLFNHMKHGGGGGLKTAPPPCENLKISSGTIAHSTILAGSS